MIQFLYLWVSASKAPLFCAHLAGNGLPDGEVAPQGPEGALARRLPAPSVGIPVGSIKPEGIKIPCGGS